jgi:hypothetical protein
LKKCQQQHLTNADLSSDPLTQLEAPSESTKTSQLICSKAHMIAFDEICETQTVFVTIITETERLCEWFNAKQPGFASTALCSCTGRCGISHFSSSSSRVGRRHMRRSTPLTGLAGSPR